MGRGMCSKTFCPLNNSHLFIKSSEITYGKAIIEVCGNSTYFVNFPERDDFGMRGSIMDYDEGVGIKLAEQFAQSLHVKRKRRDSSTLLLSYMEDDQVDDADAENKRRKVEQLTGDLNMNDVQTMAEEAGQIMPHPQP